MDSDTKISCISIRYQKYLFEEMHERKHQPGNTIYFSDSEISLAQTPNRIKNIARDIGIPDNMVELYGEYKAKVYKGVL